MTNSLIIKFLLFTLLFYKSTNPAKQLPLFLWTNNACEIIQTKNSTICSHDKTLSWVVTMNAKANANYSSGSEDNKTDSDCREECVKNSSCFTLEKNVRYGGSLCRKLPFVENLEPSQSFDVLQLACCAKQKSFMNSSLHGDSIIHCNATKRRQDCPIFAGWVNIKLTKKLFGREISSLFDMDMVECMYRCNADSACSVFQYDRISRKCFTEYGVGLEDTKSRASLGELISTYQWHCCQGIILCKVPIWFYFLIFFSYILLIGSIVVYLKVTKGIEVYKKRRFVSRRAELMVKDRKVKKKEGIEIKKIKSDFDLENYVRGIQSKGFISQKEGNQLKEVINILTTSSHSEESTESFDSTDSASNSSESLKKKEKSNK